MDSWPDTEGNTRMPQPCNCCGQLEFLIYRTACEHYLCSSCYMQFCNQHCPVKGCKNENIREVKGHLFDKVACILPHVFLLHKLPDASNAKTITWDETCLLQAFSAFLTSQQFDGHLFPKTFNAFKVWCQVQGANDDKLISQAIDDLQDGESLPIYVRSQNAGLIITIADAACDGHPEGTIISSFAASQSAVSITRAPGDLRVMYPLKSVHVPNSDLLSSSTLARQINSFICSEVQVEDPVLISTWLTGILCSLDSCLCTKFPVVTKKVRDEVLTSQHSDLPFRRSGIWMTIKVVLRILLEKELGPISGPKMYKLVLLNFMCMLCQLRSISADVGVQMMAKIGRRLYKLCKLVDDQESVFNGHLEKCHGDAKMAVKELRMRLDSRWKHTVNDHLKKTKIDLAGNMDFYKDSELTLTPLVNYIDARSNARIKAGLADGVIVDVPIPPHRLKVRTLGADPLQEAINFHVKGELTLENLFLFEHSVFHNLKYTASCDYAIAGKTFLSYLGTAIGAYEGDQIGTSRMILTCLKMIRWVDHAVCKSFPLLQEHKTGIPIQIIEHLMLPFCDDLKLAHELETYFNERMSRSCYPCLLAPYDETQMRSFYAVRHAEQDAVMQIKREEIVAEGERMALKKFLEVKRSYEEFLDYKAQIPTLICKCKYRVHRDCRKCDIKRKADNLSVTIYEKPLPPRIDFQNAIIFEVMIPEPIYHLREMLFAFLKYLGMVPPDENSTLNTWQRELSSHWPKPKKSVLNICRSSTPICRWHKTSQKLHPSNANHLFVVENSGNVHLCVGKNRIKLHHDIPPKVLLSLVFKVETNSRYSGLQWTLNDHDYKHSENEILAKQNECPCDLSLIEFKEFGAVRAGHRIQLRNLFRALKTGTLSLKADSVLNLIYQVLWRAGPRSHDKNVPAYIREAHIDLLNEGFVMEFLSLLGSLIESFSMNSDDHHPYAAITAVLLRIFSISQDSKILKKCLVHLERCRVNLQSWCRRIEELLDGMACRPIAEQNNMRRKLIAMSSLCSCTYWSDATTAACSTKRQLGDDVLPWLLSARTTQEYLDKNDSASSGSNTFRNQLRRFRECGLTYFKHFQDVVLAHRNILQSFLKHAWSGLSGSQSSNMNWKCYEDDSQWFEARVVVSQHETVLQLNIIEGHFLVNGKPPGFLPSVLKEHDDYKRVFVDLVIKVQPVCESPWKVSSKHNVRDEKIWFEENRSLLPWSKSNPYIISAEGAADGNMLEYVPENAFEEDLSSGKKLCLQQFLVRKYTHWWDMEKQRIIFRSKETHKVEYVLDLKTRFVKECDTGRYAINNAGPTYHQMRQIFNRFESEDFIEIFYHGQAQVSQMLDVQMPRMRLTFSVEKRDKGLCFNPLQYPGMKLSEVQNCGTLVGLTSCLMLEPQDKEFARNNMLLIPHGKVTNSNGSVYIDTGSLRNPPYFNYEVDACLWQLKCGETKSASAYLAYLHAMTSHPLPDPFTRHTGTERAMQLLQSGHCWSCKPYDDETTRTLRRIAKLAPMRKYKCKTKGLTTVSWPLPTSMACSDAFQIIVDKLIADSERLSVLFDSKREVKNVKFGSEQHLCEKSYWRNFKFTTEQAHVSPAFLPMVCPPLCSSMIFDCSFSSAKMNTVLKITSLVDKWNIASYSARNWHSQLVDQLPSVDGHQTDFPVLESYVEWKDLDFRLSWLRLYSLAKRVKKEELTKEWKIILSCYAFNEVAEQQLIMLHTIAVYPEMFESLETPNCISYKEPSQCTFDSEVILSIVESEIAVDFESFLEKQELAGCKVDEDDLYEKYNSLVKKEADFITLKMRQHNWPFRSCATIVNDCRKRCKLLDLSAIKTSVDVMLKKWYNNYQLQQFVNAVEEIVVKLNDSPKVLSLDATTVCQKLSLQQTSSPADVTEKSIEFNIDQVQSQVFAAAWDCDEANTVFKKGMIAGQNMFGSNILSDPRGSDSDYEIWNQLVSGLKDISKVNWGCSDDVNLEVDLKCCVEACHKAKNKYWSLIQEKIMSDPLLEFLVSAGIYQRLTPLTLLPVICQEHATLTSLQNVIGAFGVAVTCMKHALRCLKYLSTNSQFELHRELVNTPHQNWSPQERPEWLLFEIEMDLLVRPIQKKVAEWMENPVDDRNSATQLNMGQGKTMVITPLLVLSLTKKKQLCRVTVLRSLFNTNQQALGCNLGGLLLNRRVYSFPCQRDFPASKQLGCTILEMYEECVEKRGIYITTPEYRLSFQLKCYELCNAKKSDNAAKYLQIQDWLSKNARDILDESDEILQVKYQLVYALGVQMKPVGGSERWAILQRLLEHIPKVVLAISKTAVEGSVEILDRNWERGTFPRCRLLKIDIYDEFCKMLVSHVVRIEFPDVHGGHKRLLKEFLIKDVIQEGTIKQVLEFLRVDYGNALVEKALILRGLMACGVLFATLNKRWRVNYGVSQNGRSLLAVPFRAKDVAAERTEFAHVDVALVLTHLSYYYSGLSTTQVGECLARVQQSHNPEKEYKSWFHTMDDSDSSITSWNGINVEDFLQTNEKLYPALRKNKAVIDFWLGHVVLPVKVKQFPSKMLCTAWDLASDKALKPTTGFSGTNDTRILLPLTIVQNDLPELERTNCEVFEILISEENNSYQSLPLGATSKTILEKLVDAGISLLLDVGALMLDLNNEAVAAKWLSLPGNSGKKAAIYFSADDRLMVMDRSALKPVPFEISPFRGMLDQCVIYLDDVHTRGTDLKLPTGIKGCVTLGKGINKDKLVQGCMRMRKLGEGHTVCFWASNEVNHELTLMAGGAKLGSEHVLKWALDNSRNTIEDGFTHWVAAACNYLRKTAAQETYNSSGKTDQDHAALFKQVSIGEVTELMAMYGTLPTATDFPEAAKLQLQKYCPDRTGASNGNIVCDYREQVIRNCKRYVPHLKKNVQMLEEEQERELDPEQEKECEVERPGKATPWKPKLDPNLIPFLKTENKTSISCRSMRLPDGLNHTRLAEHNESANWGDDIFITTDFFRTIKPPQPTDPLDSYLRTANWIAAFTMNGHHCWLLMSPFEVNELIPMFRSNALNASLHMYSARLSVNQSTLLELNGLVLPVDSDRTLIKQIPGFYDLNTSLSIFSGCTFFENMFEFNSYCTITGIIPKPHSDEQVRAMDEGQLLPKCRFTGNPKSLIIGVINCRFNYLSRHCHVAKLVFGLEKPVFD